MRSNLVFAAAVQTPNRYLLCRMLSVSARKLNRGNEPFAQGINEVLRIAGVDPLAAPALPSKPTSADGDVLKIPIGRSA